MQKFKKWLENYWYHYKFHTIAGAFVLFVAIFLSVQLLTREHYDYTVVMYFSDNVSTELQQAVEKTCEKYADDRDGNGEVNVQVLNFSFNPADSDSNYRVAQAQSLMGELQSDTTFLFLTDTYRFDELQKSEIFEQHDFMNDKDKAAFAIKGSEFEKEIYAEFSKLSTDTLKLPGAYFSIRFAPDSGEKNYPYYEGGLKMLTKAASAKEE